ncbi:MAG: hypothetical protein NT033_07425 [Candidatus Omnitrophica bacterium]|nr:hypothetical protein [Candidatus Omnitrophota bacterium]
MQGYMDAYPVATSASDLIEAPKDKYPEAPTEADLTLNGRIVEYLGKGLEAKRVQLTDAYAVVLAFDGNLPVSVTTLKAFNELGATRVCDLYDKINEHGGQYNGISYKKVKDTFQFFYNVEINVDGAWRPASIELTKIEKSLEDCRTLVLLPLTKDNPTLGLKIVELMPKGLEEAMKEINGAGALHSTRLVLSIDDLNYLLNNSLLRGYPIKNNAGQLRFYYKVSRDATLPDGRKIQKGSVYEPGLAGIRRLNERGRKTFR